jgi:hypothetical protein
MANNNTRTSSLRRIWPTRLGVACVLPYRYSVRRTGTCSILTTSYRQTVSSLHAILVLVLLCVIQSSSVSYHRNLLKKHWELRNAISKYRINCSAIRYCGQYYSMSFAALLYARHVVSVQTVQAIRTGLVLGLSRRVLSSALLDGKHSSFGAPLSPRISLHLKDQSHDRICELIPVRGSISKRYVHVRMLFPMVDERVRIWDFP